MSTELSQSQARAPGTVLPWMFALPNQCTLLENFPKRFYSSVRFLNIIRVLTLSGVLVAFVAYVALNLSCLHYITDNRTGQDGIYLFIYLFKTSSNKSSLKKMIIGLQMYHKVITEYNSVSVDQRTIWRRQRIIMVIARLDCTTLVTRFSKSIGYRW